MSNPRQQAILSLGSNMGDSPGNLREACRRLEKKAGRILQRSKIYKTQPWGKADQPEFYNMSVRLETKSNPEELMKNILAIEKEMGRERGVKWGPRLIDIDLVLFGDLVIHTPELTVPHPEMHRRNFVLVPTLDIAGDWIHPVFGESIEELYWKSQDPLEVFLAEETDLP